MRRTVRKRGRPAAAHDANRWAPDACGRPNLVWETAPHAGRVTQAGTVGMRANSDSRPKGACKESPALPPARCPLRGLRSLLIYNLCALGGLQRRRPAAAGRKPRAPPTDWKHVPACHLRESPPFHSALPVGLFPSLRGSRKRRHLKSLSSCHRLLSMLQTVSQ